MNEDDKKIMAWTGRPPPREEREGLAVFLPALVLLIVIPILLTIAWALR